jgi:hypothetical protein
MRRNVVTPVQSLLALFKTWMYLLILNVFSNIVVITNDHITLTC